MDYFEMKLLQTPKRIRQSDGSIKEIYYQPERLSEKTYYRNEDGTYPHLEPVIGCDSPNSDYK